MTLALGVDISEGAELTQETMDAWKAAGVRWVCVQYSGMLPHYLERLAGQGFEVDVYVYLYFPLSPWSQKPEERVANALNWCNHYEVGRVWLDVEDPNDHGPQADIVAALERCVGLVEAAGYRCGIYSGAWAYPQRCGSYTGFADRGLPLWNADYTSQAPVADLTKEPADLRFRYGPYGGWNAPTIWQWHNTTMLGGHSVDLNILEEDMPTPITQPTLEQAIEAMIKAGAIMIAGNQNLADLDEVSKNAIRWVAAQVGKGN